MDTNTQQQQQDVAVQTPHDGQQQIQHQSQVAPAHGESAGRRAHYVRPRAHLTESANEFLLQVELPGVNRDGLEVTFENGELAITGHRTPFQAGSAELIYRESRQVDFRRVFELDPTVDAAKIQAHLEQGVLTLAMPKAESARARRIEVQHPRG